jgi:hypothetical protein
VLDREALAAQGGNAEAAFRAAVSDSSGCSAGWWRQPGSEMHTTTDFLYESPPRELVRRIGDAAGFMVRSSPGVYLMWS